MPTHTFTGRVRDQAGHLTTSSVSVQVPTLFGMEAPVGGATQAVIDTYPKLMYMRDFGTDGPDADTLPELPSRSAGKWTMLPAGAYMHVSWKDDVEQLSTWLNGLNQRILLTWYHEPMGDVVPATYRTTAQRVTEILSTHPNRGWVIGHGPIVTRYWLDEGGGNPADWAYPGMTHYGIDCYMNVPSSSSYYSNTKMFGTVFAKVRAACPGIRLVVPEYGLVRLTSDTSGSVRAQAMRDHAAYLRAQPDVYFCAYWNYFVTGADYRVYAGTPEAQAWTDIQAA